ncbi:hypothetical protein C2G38_2058218 [Gigaspora rosea]|uniref:F-box domain-containing protein n=1 Tax=Gigaspora rosea TaxID=44941 RepID=A0A397W2B2_9GLOM|nr:hypothetical protein C2G38_2058218 [Gigaspora rosea]
MPELMENILNHLSNESYSLYSCALVSRHWCKMSIPTLWRDPFSFNQKPMFISRYFSFLSDDDKFILNECGITVDFPNTLFNYAKFLKVLDLSLLDDKVQEWIDSQIINLQKHISKYDIFNLLFKLFIESGAILTKLDVHLTDVIIESEVFYSLGRNNLFFSRLQDISVEVATELFGIGEAITLLRILARNTTKINTLKLNILNNESLMYRAVANIIKSQNQLKRFDLICETELHKEFYCIVSALESQRKSLQEIKIWNCDYSAEFEVLMKCENLKVVRIIDCFEEKKLLNILNTSLYNINTLEISSYAINAPDIMQILERSGLLLQRLKVYSEDHEICSQSILLDTLITFCPNIMYLYISYVKFSSQLLKLINCLQKLQFLTLVWINDGSEEEMKERVMQLAKLLPQSLQYLNLGDIWVNSHIDILLNHCEAPLKKLLFSINYDNDYEKTIDALIRFCIRKKSLNDVNVSRYVNKTTYVFRFRISSVSNTNWKRVQKDLEGFVNLVPYESIVVDC